MSDKELSTTYSPDAIEARWYTFWEEQGFFKAAPTEAGESYSLVIPPPNVTGALHMGHAFGHTQMDLYIRRARMQGKQALWIPGTDHAGIATQNVVERELAKQGITRHDLGRGGFIDKVWEWKEEYGGRITEQIRRLGNSCDWTRERFTMDEGLSRAVRTVFVTWYDDGLIYRGNRIINWCPRCTTALSDIEVEHEDVAGELITFRYDLTDGSGSLSVATTRIETMLGDTGIAVHPEDDRYRHLVGKTVQHPFFSERVITVVADEAVDPEFGTGAVKATPAHDPTDFEIGERQGLEKINIFDKEAHLNEFAGTFTGLDRYEARRAVYEELDSRGYIEKTERPYVHPVGHCYRCHTEVEPWLSEQWFVRMAPLAEPAIEAVRDGRIRIVPERFSKQYISWMENIRDWCISRQIWWGHRIPVWYCEECDTSFAALEDPQGCKGCGSAKIEQDPDVLDTWFSSQLWPFSTLGWPDESSDLDFFYPTALMVTGYEILYLWVARMIFSGLYFMDDVPFKDVLIHGIVRDPTGKKMSKSLGNVLDPIELIDEFGADALRFSLASVATSGNDVNFSQGSIVGARNFANKLWNASRFVLMSLEGDRPELPDESARSVADRWILSRLAETTADYERQLTAYNLAEAMRILHRFIWTEYCDWYIELAKLELRGDRPAEAKGVLVHVLDRILRLLHPVMPFITEEIWTGLRPQAGSIMSSPWPKEEATHRDLAAEASLERFQDVVGAIRRLKVDHDIPQGKKLDAVIAAGEHAGEVEAMETAYLTIARLGSVTLSVSLPSTTTTVKSITAAGIEVAVDLGGVVDLDAERARLSSKIDELEAEIQRATKKLANESFVGRAPAEVVEKERQKLEEHTAAKSKVETQLAALGE